MKKPSRIALLVLLAAVTHLGVAVPAEAGTKPSAQAPQLSQLGDNPHPQVRDRVITGGARATQARASASGYGGYYTTPAGDRVHVILSNGFGADESVAQGWADFLGGLVHGGEISRITAYVATQSEISGICGPDAYACYASWNEQMYVPGHDPGDGTSIEDIAAHEYGHHVAKNRRNSPWPAIDWGTKRWASYQGVCPGVRAGEFFPGNETWGYHENPGEGFAEAYSVLNGGSWGGIVDSWFYPDSLALQLLRRDVLHPWNARTLINWRRTLDRSRTWARRGLETFNDGVLRVVLDPPPGSDFDLYLYAGARNRVLVSSTRYGAGNDAVAYRICGNGRVRIHVKRYTGSGTFRVRAYRP